MIQFKCVGIGEKTWTPSQEEMDKWAAAYPALDLASELRRMETWLLANPNRRKTAGGMPRFVVNWLNSTQNKGFTSRHPQRIPPDPSDALPRNPVTGTIELRRRIEAEVRAEHPDWDFNEVRKECAKRFNRAIGA